MSLVRSYLGLFSRNRSLAQLLFGEFVSGIGDWLYLVAILVVVYSESSSPVLLGIVGAARILPYVLLSVPAGIVADRFDRRMVLLVTDVARGVLMVVCSPRPWRSARRPSRSSSSRSSRRASRPSSVRRSPRCCRCSCDEDDLGPANSAWATLDNVAFIVGPALAGILLAVGGLEVAFLLNAVSFGVVAVVLWRMEIPERALTGEAAEDAEEEPVGWRDLVRPMAGPFILDAATSFVGGGLGVLTVVIAIDVLGAGEAGTGWLQAATGVGGVVAGVAGGALLARRLSVPLLIGGVVGGIGFAWLALSGSLLTAMLAIAIAVAGLLLLDIVNTTLIQRMVPDALRGRAMGILQTSSAITYSLGSLVLPLVADTWGMAVVLVGSGVLTLFGVAVALVLSRRETRSRLSTRCA